MGMSFSIKFWGVRGSLPSSPPPSAWVSHIEGVLQNFFNSGHHSAHEVPQYMQGLEEPVVGGYGSATTCVELNYGNSQIIIDGGSGIRSISERILKGTAKRTKGPYHIFMTHFHWDHVIGLPFFVPHFIPGEEIHYYAVQSDLEPLIRGLFRKPYFPVPFEALQAKIHFHILEPRKPINVGEFKVTPYQLDHPDPCWGFKVEAGGKNYAHCVDTEGTRVTQEALGLDLPLYQNIDLMYFDAQYTLPELAEKANWGHSAAQVGLEIAFREGIKRVLFAHHDPGARTDHVVELRRQTREYYESMARASAVNKETLPVVSWDFAHEGLEVVL